MLRLLIVVAILMILLYVVGSRAITSLNVVDEETGEITGKKLNYSPFRVTFKDQYLCYSFEAAAWVMRGSDTDEDCRGPFIDSGTLCREMEQVGAKQVRLYWEGRVLECT